MSDYYASVSILTPLEFTFPSAAAPAQTAEGRAVWDSDDDVLTIGTGAARKTLVDLTATQTLSAKTLTSPVITTSPTAAGSTWADLGAVTTVDVNGGTVDGVTIGASVAPSQVRVQDNALQIENPAATFIYTIVGGAILANRQLNLPVLTGTDIVATLGLAQTFTARQTFSLSGALNAIDLISAHTSPNAIFRGRTSRGSIAIPTATQSGDNLVLVVGSGYGDNDYADGGYIAVIATENWSNTAHGSKINFVTVDNTTTTQDIRLTLEQNGVVIWGTGVYHNGFRLGLAGTATGSMTIEGVTSGVVTVTVAAVAGTWTLTLPPDDGDAGEQLQTNGAGVTTWEAAASTREVKDISGFLDPAEALRTVLGAPIERWRYKQGMRGVGGDYETEFVGVVADRAPWAMKDNGKHFNPINAFGYAAASIQALAERVERLELHQVG